MTYCLGLQGPPVGDPQAYFPHGAVPNSVQAQPHAVSFKLVDYFKTTSFLFYACIPLY